MSESLRIKTADSCQFDLVSLGEVMLRLDPGETRIRTARQFTAWEGGGEYNVARGLRRCFGMRTAIVTALADNEVGRLVENFILQGGVDPSWIRWVPYDGCGRNVRNGLNFTERGFGIRGALGTSDRGHTAVAAMRPDDIDWDRLFGQCGVRWFHSGGIYAALSDTTAQVVLSAVQSAKKYGTIVSYDLNYRPSLWNGIGGVAKAREVNCEIAKHVDVMIGNEEDFTTCLGMEVKGLDENVVNIQVDAFKQMIENVVAAYSNFQVVATTLRTVKTATVNSWGAILWHAGNFYEATHRPDLEILDRVGGGDSFSSGLIYGLMTGRDPQMALEYGAAHGALAMTTPGDTSMATKEEVEKLIQGGTARVVR